MTARAAPIFESRVRQTRKGGYTIPDPTHHPPPDPGPDDDGPDGAITAGWWLIPVVVGGLLGWSVIFWLIV